MNRRQAAIVGNYARKKQEHAKVSEIPNIEKEAIRLTHQDDGASVNIGPHETPLAQRLLARGLQNLMAHEALEIAELLLGQERDRAILGR
jgi:hypothetical protein